MPGVTSKRLRSSLSKRKSKGREFRSSAAEQFFLAREIDRRLNENAVEEELLQLAARLEVLLEAEGYSEKSVMDQTWSALIAEANRKLDRAIEYRERELAVRLEALEFAVGAKEPDHSCLLHAFPPEDMFAAAERLAKLYGQVGDEELQRSTLERLGNLRQAWGQWVVEGIRKEE